MQVGGGNGPSSLKEAEKESSGIGSGWRGRFVAFGLAVCLCDAGSAKAEGVLTVLFDELREDVDSRRSCSTVSVNAEGVLTVLPSEIRLELDSRRPAR